MNLLMKLSFRSLVYRRSLLIFVDAVKDARNINLTH